MKHIPPRQRADVTTKQRQRVHAALPVVYKRMIEQVKTTNTGVFCRRRYSPRTCAICDARECRPYIHVGLQYTHHACAHKHRSFCEHPARSISYLYLSLGRPAAAAGNYRLSLVTIATASSARCVRYNTGWCRNAKLLPFQILTDFCNHFTGTLGSRLLPYRRCFEFTLIFHKAVHVRL